MDTIPADELRSVLENHDRWVKAGGSCWFEDGPSDTGAKADLAGRDLSGADLSDKQLTGARAPYANFTDANLRSTTLASAYLKDATFANAVLEQSNLRNAHLEGANFSGARLWEADLRASVLRNADLSTVSGLEAVQLAGADLTLAKLPDAIARFETVKVLDEAAKHAQTILFTVLVVCAYVWLTIAATDDAALLLNSATSTLPIVGTDVRIVGFYMIAPLALLGMYLYLHVYLQRLWEGLASQPAVFPDGRPLDQRVYPWIAVGISRNYFPFLSARLSRFSKLQLWLTGLLLWAVVPITQVALWARYLPRHDWLGTGVAVGAFVATLVFGVIAYFTARGTLKGMTFGPLHARTAARDLLDRRGAALTVCVLAMTGISWMAMKGPQVAPVGYWPYINLAGATLSTKLDGWTPETTRFVLGANLAGQNLRFANLSGAFLARANVAGADITGARLLSADLREANFTKATLERAELSGANLRQARLIAANLRSANFGEIPPERTQMPRRAARTSGSGRSGWGGSVDITRTDFTAADLSGANLEGWFRTESASEFIGANFYGTSNASVFIEEALSRGAVCMPNTTEWLTVARGDIEVPDVNVKGIDINAHCRLSGIPFHRVN